MLCRMKKTVVSFPPSQKLPHLKVVVVVVVVVAAASRPGRQRYRRERWVVCLSQVLLSQLQEGSCCQHSHVHVLHWIVDFWMQCLPRLASHSLFSDWTGAGEKGLVTLGYSLCKSGMLLNINVTCKLSILFWCVKAESKLKTSTQIYLASILIL